MELKSAFEIRILLNLRDSLLDTYKELQRLNPASEWVKVYCRKLLKDVQTIENNIHSL